MYVAADKLPTKFFFIICIGYYQYGRYFVQIGLLRVDFCQKTAPLDGAFWSSRDIGKGQNHWN